MQNKNKSRKNNKVSGTYEGSGVNLNEAARAIDLIKKPVFSTFNDNVLNNLSSYAGLYSFNKENFCQPVLVSSTDGVGTKLLLAKQTARYENIGQDLVGMCINDIICCGASPLFFLDYIACGSLVPEKIQAIVSSIAESCRACNTALIGGEIAEMPDMYSADEIDLAGFAVGVVEKDKIIGPGLVNKDDIVLGIMSSGIHSNGYSLVRKIIADRNLDLRKNYNFKSADLKNKNLGEILMEPTRLYYRFIKKLLESGIKLNGIAHITGGGFYDNLARIIPDYLDIEIAEKSWPVPEIFYFLKKEASIKKHEMYRVFNMGIGMALVADKKNADSAIKCLAKIGEKAHVIGRILKGSGRVFIT